eukprot:scaffold101071_cov85-Phaeocystis_antarctica.AAC.1
MMLVRSPGHVSSIVDKVSACCQNSCDPPCLHSLLLLLAQPSQVLSSPHTHSYPLASLYTPHTLVLLTDQVLACCAVPRRPSAMATPRTASASGATPQDSRSKSGLALSRHPPTLKAH